MKIHEILLAILPGLLLAWVMFRLDKYEREPFGWLIACFIFGGLLTFPAVEIELWGFQNWPTDAPRTIGQTLFLAFILVAFNEEFLKMLGVLVLPFSRPVFNEPLDGMVYSMMVAMGFATAENLVYAERFGLETTLVRAFTAVPAHAAFAVFSGYFVGLAKFDRPNRWKLIGKGFALTVLMHGFYDFFIIQEFVEWLTVLATVGLYLSLYYSMRLIRLHQENSPFRGG